MRSLDLLMVLLRIYYSLEGTHSRVLNHSANDHSANDHYAHDHHYAIPRYGVATISTLLKITGL